MSIYKGMLEASVITVDDNGESTVPYYDKEVLSNYVTTYLENNIKNYVKNASKYFSLKKLVLFTVFSLILSVLLAISIIKAHYEGVGLIFSIIVLALIIGSGYKGKSSQAEGLPRIEKTEIRTSEICSAVKELHENSRQDT